MKIYFKTKKTKVFIIAIFLALLSIPFFTLNAFASSTKLESILRNASGTTSDEVVAESRYLFVASIDGPGWTGGYTNKADRHDVVRVFTFFDKTKVELFGYYTHKKNGNPGTAGDYIYGFALVDEANDAYASEVDTIKYSRGGSATRGAQKYGSSGDGSYNGKPLYYISSLDITSATGGRNPCKEVYDEAIATTGGFQTLRAATASDLGCVGFERFRGYDETGGSFFAPALGDNYPNNSDLHGLDLKIKSTAANGDTDLISVATSDGYTVSGTSNEPPIKENVKTLTVVGDVLKGKTIDILNPTEGGETKAFNVGVEFLSDVSGFVKDADFRFVENGTDTEAGTITRIRLLDPFYLTVPYDPITDTNRGDSEYARLNGRFFVVTVVPRQGLSGNYQFEIKPSTAIDTVKTSSEYDSTHDDTYGLSVQVFSTFLFSDFKITDSTLTNSFVLRDYDPGGGSLKIRDYFSRSNDIDVEFIANSNNGGGHPLASDFSIKEVGTSTTDCTNNTATFSSIIPDTTTTNLYSMTITLPTGKYNCRLSYSQTISGTKIEKTLPIVFTGAEFLASNTIQDKVFDTFYINAETPVVSFNPSPATDVKSNSRTHNITSSSAFNYFTTDIGANVDVYDELINQATDCDDTLAWSSKTKSTDDFTTDDQSQNGKYICVRVYDDFVTNNLSADSFYSYKKFEVQNIDTIAPTILSAELENSGTQSHDFKVKVSFSEDVRDINIADFSFVENDSTSGSLVKSTAGAVTKVEAFDSAFTISTGARTTDTTTIEGQYFLVSVTANDDIETTTDKIYKFQIDTDISDEALNSVGSSASNKTLEININTQTKPTVSAALTNSGVLGKEFVVGLTFSEEVINVDAADFDFIEVTNGTDAGSIKSIISYEDSSFTPTDQTPNISRYYQVTVTAVDDLVSIANGYAFRVLNDSTNAITDKVGNLLDDGGVSGDVRFNFLISNIDTTKPTATTELAVTGTQNGSFKVNVTFSEVVNNIDINDFEFTDGTSSVAAITKVEAFDETFTTSTGSSTTDTTTISGQYFVVSLTPNNSLEDTFTFKVLADAANTITDALSNSFVEEDINSQIQISVDTTDPTATIEPITETQNGAFNVKVSFSESVKNVDTGDFRFVKKNTNSIFSTITKVEAFDETFTTSTGSSTTDTTTISGQYFVVSLTPSNDIQTDSTTTYSFEIFPNSTNTITDTIGNALSLIASADIGIDTKKPTATVAVDGSGTQGKNFAVNVTFSEVVNNVNVDDFTFIQTGTTTSAGTITEVQLHSDSNFNDTNPSTTTQTGQYFKVLVEGIDDIETSSATTYTFNVIASTDQANLIADPSTNTFQVNVNSSILVDINTESAPTVLSLSTPNGIQAGVFEINVTFSEEVSNVDIGDFRFVLKDQDTASATTFGTIVVELHSDSNFNDTNPSTTTDTTTLSGTYFKIKVTPQDNLTTDTGVVDYEFQIINDTTNSIIDGIGNALGAQSFSGVIRGVTDVNIDTSNPKTESISLDTTGTQTTTFDVRVSFTEAVNNVGINNFEFTDGTNSFGVIKSVVVYNSTFETAGDSTDISSSVAGRYFKVSIKPNEDINDTYTFKVLPGSINDDATNTFETSSNDTLSVTVNTERAPTLTSLSIVNPSVTPKTGDFEIDVIFSESVNGVDIDDFRFVRTGTVNLKGSITKVEAFDETFTTSTGSSTTDTTTISGQYFRVSVHPKDTLRTNENGTPSVTYTFEILSSGSITDGAGNAFDSTSGIATTLDVAVDTLDPLIIATEIINNKLVLTSSISLNDVTVTGTGGFTVTGNDGTAYTVSNVAIAGITITISFTPGTIPTDRGTYTYTKISSLTIQTSSSNRLSNIASTTYGPDFTLDLDSSGDYTASKDGLFLYLYTQTAYTLNDTALSQLIDSNSSLVDTKAKINDGINDDSLDLDSSGDYTASKDGLFLYLYTQTAYTLNDTALSQLIDSSSSLQGTKDNIAKFLP